MNECVLSTGATDALVAISIHSAEDIYFALNQLIQNITLSMNIRK